MSVARDHIQRFIFEKHAVRGQIVRLSHSYQQIMRQHHYPRVIQYLLGESLLAVSLLNSMSKNSGKLTLQFQGNGDLQLLSARCTHDLSIRGFAKWTGILPSAQKLSAALGQGQLVITFEPEQYGERYQSIIGAESPSIAETLERYFQQSEQLPTQLVFAIDDECAVGLMLQMLPGHEAEREESWEHLIALTNTLQSKELLSTDNATLLHRLYHQEDVRVFDERPIRFGCGCSVEKMANALVLSDRAEIESLLEENAFVEVTCDFCGNQYRFDEVEIAEIFDQGGHSGPGSGTIH
jgi:molecular chaperone Hsp33